MSRKIIPAAIATVLTLAAIQPIHTQTTEQVHEVVAETYAIEIVPIQESKIKQVSKEPVHYEDIPIGKLDAQPIDLTPIEEYENIAPRGTYLATDYIVDTLLEAGYNRAVIAGIIGNCMTECGGQTMNLFVTASDDDFYGICQWSLYYCPGVKYADLAGQVDYLRNTIKKEFDTFGYLFGYSFSDFMAITDASEAAKVFAEVYERCCPESYGIRQDNAEEAFDYYFNGRN